MEKFRITVVGSCRFLHIYFNPVIIVAQDWVGQRETLVGSQLWWNWEVDSIRYTGWQQLIKDLSVQHIKVMTYCNPCLAPVNIVSLNDASQ